MNQLFIVVLTLSFPLLVVSQTNKAADASNQFGFSLYKVTAKTQGNLFFSPFSIEVALAMTTAGAQQETLAQILTTLHLSSNYHSEFRDLLGQLRVNRDFKRFFANQTWAEFKGLVGQLVEHNDYQLFVANRIWGQSGTAYYRDFMKLLRENYGGELAPVDFKKQTELSRKKINQWVQQQTQDKIKDLLKEGVITKKTDLVLTNAIYFKGSWVHPFVKKWTKDEQFQISPTEKKRIPFMNNSKEFRYTENPELQYLQLPYKGNELVMDVLLPRPEIQLATIEQKLDSQIFMDLIKQAKSNLVVVSLPKFKAESEFNLGNTLSSLGMPLAFDEEEANFRGMRRLKPNENLYISAVVHKAVVDVNEEGTEAAAATGVVLHVPTAAPKKAVFRADRPFLFFIRHVKTGVILFMGRYSQP